MVCDSVAHKGLSNLAMMFARRATIGMVVGTMNLHNVRCGRGFAVVLAGAVTIIGTYV